MTTKNRVNKIIFLSTLFALLLCFNNVTYAAIMGGQAKQDEAPQYVAGEILVKFREGVNPQDVLKEINLEVKDVSRIHSIKPAVAKFKKDYKIEKDTKGGWYSFLGKNYKEVNDIPDEEIFKEAYKNMPEAEKGLYRKYKIVLPQGISVEEAVAKLKNNPNVESAYPNYIRETFSVPNDPRYPEQWALPDIHAPEAWDITQGSPDVVIAIIDTGVDYNHEDLAANIWMNSAEDINHNGRFDNWPSTETRNGVMGDLDGIDNDGNGFVDDVIGYDFVSVPGIGVYPGEDPGPLDNNPMDFHGHGTHCSGIAAAAANNGIGITGVAPNVKIMAIRAGYKGLNGGGYLRDYDIEKAIMYAMNNGAKVISMSFGGAAPGAYADGIQTAYAQGIVLAAAAGNSATSDIQYPAGMDEVISVAAWDGAARASFSNFGAWVDVAAPGTGILSTLPNNQYASWNGTSMACPYVAGLAALALSRYPDYSNEQIAWLIKKTVGIIPELEPCFSPGFGVINCYSALICPVIAPRLAAKIVVSDINYQTFQVNVTYSAGGEDFSRYVLKYKRLDNEDEWHELMTSTNPAINETFIWGTNSLSDGLYFICVSAATGDGRVKNEYAQVVINRSRYHYVQPEAIFLYYRESVDGVVQGLYRLGAKVTLIGRVFGEYHLEWRKAGSADGWRSDYFDYNVIEGHLAFWDTSAVQEEGIYEIRLTDEVDSEKYTEIRLDKNLRIGWPVTLDPYNCEGVLDSNRIASQIGNIDGDPQLEIVTLRCFDSWARVYTFEQTGEIKVGWPKIIQNKYGNSTYPALADIDKDGKDEILITVAGGDASETIYCFKGDGTVVFKKDFSSQDGYYTNAEMRDPLIVADLNKDGLPEIIYRDAKGIYILDNKGNNASPAWPKMMDVGGPIQFSDINYTAVGNFDDDNDLELVVVQNKGYASDHLNGDVIIHVFNFDGTYVAGWPKIITDRYCEDGICCGDMDGDGRDDIAVVVRRDTSNVVLEKREVYVIKSDGTDLFIKDTITRDDTTTYWDTKNLMADLNNDGKAEIIFQNGKGLEALDYLGNSIGNWPFLSLCNISPSLAVDIDGDGEIEVVGIYREGYGSTDNLELVILDKNGIEKSSNPFNRMIIPRDTMALHFEDINKDGYGELVIDSQLPVWDTRWSAPIYRPHRPGILVYNTGADMNYLLSHWPTAHGDKNNSACFKTVTLPSIPNAPSKLNASAVSSNRIDLAWQDNARNEDGFKIEQQDQFIAGRWFEIASVGANTASYSHIGLPPDVHYSYRVRAYNSLGYSECSNTAGATTLPPPPNAPSNLTVATLISDKHQLRLRWQDNAGNENGFKIERSLTGQEGDFSQIAQDGPNNSTAPSFVTYNDTGLSLGVTYYYRVRAYNSSGDSAYTNIANRTTPINHPPAITINPPGDKTIEVNQALTFTITISDSDIGDNFGLLPTTLPDGATLTPQKSKGLGQKNILFAWAPSYTQAGVYPLTFTVSDGELTASASVQITVNNVNRPPTLNSIDDQTVNEGQTLDFTVTATDPDQGDVLTYSYSASINLHDTSGISFDPTTGRFIWTPDYTQSGTYYVTFTVTDKGGLTDSKKIAIKVNNVNRPPVITPIGNKEVNEGEKLEFKVVVNDPDGDPLDIQTQPLPDGATIARVVDNEVETGTIIFSWTPTHAQVGTHQITFTAKDLIIGGSGYTVSETITITVNSLPIISIELEGPSTWVLNRVHLGELRKNRDTVGKVMHAIKNTGNVAVNVEIGYVSSKGGIQPGLKQGKDTFVTLIDAGDMKLIIPPDGRAYLGDIPHDSKYSLSLPLIYGAPTTVSGGATNMSANYEIRAYAIDGSRNGK